MAAGTNKSAFFDKRRNLVVVPGAEMTLKRLVGTVNRVRKAKKFSPYKIARLTGLTRDSVIRFLEGYEPLGDTRVKNPDQPGRVRLETALAIAQAVGVDFEVVTREKLHRGSID